jgi:hypothetical protein
MRYILRRSTGVHELAVAMYLLVASIGAPQVGHGQNHDARQSGPAQGSTVPAIPAGTIIRVRILDGLKPSRLRPGAFIQGDLTRPIYLNGIEAIPSGTHVQLVTRKVEKLGPARNRAAALFREILELYWSQRLPESEYALSFSSATITPSNGTPLPMKVSFLRGIQPADVRLGTAEKAGPRSPGGRPPQGADRKRQSILALQLDEPLPVPWLLNDGRLAFAQSAGAPASVSIHAGTRVHLLLLNAVEASKSHQGDSLQARLEEPVLSGGHVVLPEGTLFHGVIAKRVPPRRLNRPASLRLNFERMTLPDRADREVSALLSAAEVAHGAGIRMDPEGTIQSPHRTKTQLALTLAAGYLTGKVADDTADTVIKVALAGGNATLTRYIGIGTALFYFLAHRGSDVIIPKYAELEVTFDRPLELILPRAAQHSRLSTSSR